MSGGIDGGGLSIPRGGPMPRRGERYPGIHAIEVYVPRHCVQADALEVEHDCLELNHPIADTLYRSVCSAQECCLARRHACKGHICYRDGVGAGIDCI